MQPLPVLKVLGPVTFCDPRPPSNGLPPYQAAPLPANSEIASHDCLARLGSIYRNDWQTVKVTLDQICSIIALDLHLKLELSRGVLFGHQTGFYLRHCGRRSMAGQTPKSAGNSEKQPRPFRGLAYQAPGMAINTLPGEAKGPYVCLLNRELYI